MKSSEPSAQPAATRAPQAALILMVVIAAALAFVSVFAHIQKWRKPQIEKVILKPVTSPTPEP